MTNLIEAIRIESNKRIEKVFPLVRNAIDDDYYVAVVINVAREMATLKPKQKR